MYFSIDPSTSRVSVFKTLGDACREYCLQRGVQIAKGQDPVVIAKGLSGGIVPAVNFYQLMDLIAESDSPTRLALAIKQGLREYYE